MGLRLGVCARMPSDALLVQRNRDGALAAGTRVPPAGQLRLCFEETVMPADYDIPECLVFKVRSAQSCACACLCSCCHLFVHRYLVPTLASCPHSGTIFGARAGAFACCCNHLGAYLFCPLHYCTCCASYHFICSYPHPGKALLGTAGLRVATPRLKGRLNAMKEVDLGSQHKSFLVLCRAAALPTPSPLRQQRSVHVLAQSARPASFFSHHMPTHKTCVKRGA